MAAPASFSWFRGEVHLDVLLGVVLLAGAYTWATVAWRRPAPLGPPLAFFAGLATIAYLVIKWLRVEAHEGIAFLVGLISRFKLIKRLDQLRWIQRGRMAAFRPAETDRRRSLNPALNGQAVFWATCAMVGRA